MRDEIEIGPADPDDFADCAEIHIRTIPNGFLPSFGQSFLRRLYEFLATSPRSFLIVARSGGNTCGFICGSYGTGSLYRSFALQKFPFIVGPIFKNLFVKGTIQKIWEVVRYPAGEVQGDLPGSEILNFCVCEKSQGKGVGRHLFTALCDEYRSKEIQSIRIVTGSDQITAQRFYDSVGATLASRVAVHGNHESLVYTYQI